ncbi:hypothetical protein [Natrinema versiforme]|uniref:Uncharacterized protein n=1 Tax=Natrinema versiforme TaxID=88724 RepID=A0A4P8WM30_9EURY|nr:hypothetical protein [Natrinema versiforme]QCS44637.1 hypothetical protein FEJ81_20215 [Natrinema versiforme]
MTDTNTTVPTVQAENRPQTNSETADPINLLIQEFGQEAGKQVGSALAEEIHKDPEVRRAAATGAGVGLGVIIGLGLLAAATQ